MTLIEALEKLALISKNGLDTLIYIHESTNEPIKISDAIKAIRRHAIDIYELENYSITPVLHQLDPKIIYPHYDFKHLTEKYFEIGMKLNDFSIHLVEY